MRTGGMFRTEESTMSDTSLDRAENEDIRSVVREKYGALPVGPAAAPCCGPEGGAGVLPALGYTQAQAEAIPQGANLGLGCGNPLAHAEVRAGETVLDLGSGAGIDAFLAAREVGSGGHVIGV